jgi:hypothetical protein
MALSERENLILLQLEQSLRTDGRAHTRRRIVVAVATAVAALAAVALITWAALTPASVGTLAATGVAGALFGGLAFCYRVQAQAQALRLYAAAGQRLRHARLPLRRRKQR